MAEPDGSVAALTGASGHGFLAAADPAADEALAASPPDPAEPAPAASQRIRAGAAECDITPPVGHEIQHFHRISAGVHVPLFARCFYMEDYRGAAVAIVCLDLFLGHFDACNVLRAEIKEQVGVDVALINFSHSHASCQLGPRGKTQVSNDTGSRWNDATLDKIVTVVRLAKERAEPASLRAGRAPVQVGFNRRVARRDGHVCMDVNREGPVVPWVNVLVANRVDGGPTLAVLFEHPAHPVIVPHTNRLISSDFPGVACRALQETLGGSAVAMFGQGCAGNINGFALRSSNAQAEEQGLKLAEAVLQAISTSEPIETTELCIRTRQRAVPNRALPSEEMYKSMLAECKGQADRMRQLAKVREHLDKGTKPVPRKLEAWAVSLGYEWCLTTMPHELFCEYELWIEDAAPFGHNMVFAYTQGYGGYIATDEELRKGPKGGYEAASFPSWHGQVWTDKLGPPAVGCESIIKDTLVQLWADEHQ